MVKLDGKAFGIVQLAGKGEGLEAWRQLNLEYDGKSGNRQAALLRGILNPRAGWETDARDGRWVVESLNRWEKTISLYRTASGVDISDGIMAATVLEHSPEAHQNILKQAPSNVRASHGAMRGWLREYAETLRRYDGLVRYQWRSTKGKSKGKGKSKDGKGKGKGKKGENSKDQKPVTKTEQFQGYCGYCEKWGHKRADCRKRIADGKSKGAAAAASADNDEDVAAVMEVDDSGQWK